MLNNLWLWHNSCNVFAITSCEVFINVSMLLVVKKCDYWKLFSIVVVFDFVVAAACTTFDCVSFAKAITLDVNYLKNVHWEYLKKVLPKFTLHAAKIIASMKMIQFKK